MFTITTDTFFVRLFFVLLFLFFCDIDIFKFSNEPLKTIIGPTTISYPYSKSNQDPSEGPSHLNLLALVFLYGLILLLLLLRLHLQSRSISMFLLKQNIEGDDDLLLGPINQSKQETKFAVKCGWSVIKKEKKKKKKRY